MVAGVLQVFTFSATVRTGVLGMVTAAAVWVTGDARLAAVTLTGGAKSPFSIALWPKRSEKPQSSLLPAGMPAGRVTCVLSGRVHVKVSGLPPSNRGACSLTLRSPTLPVLVTVML
jgi:hypothetical protein